MFLLMHTVNPQYVDSVHGDEPNWWDIGVWAELAWANSDQWDGADGLQGEEMPLAIQKGQGYELSRQGED